MTQDHILMTNQLTQANIKVMESNRGQFKNVELAE